MASESVTETKGMAIAQVARDFFDVQLHFADVFAAKSAMPLTDAITFHTNFHRLFAYGNLGKAPPDPEFAALVRELAQLTDPVARLDRLVTAYADRPYDPWPSDRFPFGRHFACEAPNDAGVVRIHFRNRINTDAIGPLDAANLPQRRADLTAMVTHIAQTWPETKTINGASWLYNTDGYRRLFPKDYGASRTPLLGPRPIHGLSTWGQFINFRGVVKPAIVETFRQNLTTLDPAQPWLAFPLQVLTTTAPLVSFREEYGV